MSLTQQKLKELVNYDPITGIFTRLTKSAKNVNIGDVVGSSDAYGRLRLTIDKKTYKLHRLAFLYMTGEMPDKIVDHINCDKLDNRWINLRLVNVTESNQNRRKKINNSSGLKGVSYSKRSQKWRAKIGFNKKIIHLGLFDDKQMAYDAYCKASQNLHKNYGNIE